MDPVVFFALLFMFCLGIILLAIIFAHPFTFLFISFCGLVLAVLAERSNSRHQALSTPRESAEPPPEPKYAKPHLKYAKRCIKHVRLK